MLNGTHVFFAGNRTAIQFDIEQASRDTGISVSKLKDAADSGRVSVGGKFRDLGDGLYLIELDTGGKAIGHEYFHFLAKAVLSDQQYEQLISRYGSEEKAAQAYARARNIGEANTLFDKIRSFVDRLIPGGVHDILTREPTAATPTARSGATDLDARAKRMRQEGALNLSGIQSIAARIGRWATHNFAPRGGMDRKLWDTLREWKGARAAAEFQAQAVRNDLRGARDRLKKSFGVDIVNDALNQAVYGNMTPDAFAQAFRLAPTDPIVTALRKFNTDRATRGTQLANMLERAGNNPALVQAIRDNDYYLTRFYEAHLLGEAFQPKPADVQLAVDSVRAGLEDAVNKLARKASAAQMSVGRGASVADYLNTGDVTMLAGLAPSQRDAIVDLGSQFFKLRQILDPAAARGNAVVLAFNARALQDAAESTVSYYLNRTADRGQTGRGVIDIGSLHKRYLEGAFRALYGEVTDPTFVAARTEEVQARTLIDQTLFARVFAEGKDVWWSSLPSNERGHTVRVPDDARRYGALSGKYVAPELHDVLAGKSRNAVMDTYFRIQSTMRLLKLFGPRTILRNYTTAMTGFALGSGDALQPGYTRNFAKANVLAKDALAGKPDALRQVSELAKLDVFRAQSGSILDALREAVSASPGAGANGALQRWGMRYAFIDFPTKVASYWTNLERIRKANPTMPIETAQREAAEHVRKFYQHAESVPNFARTLSRLPLSDYPGYFVDSVRIAGNQVSNAITSAGRGEVRPLIGLILSRALSAVVLSGEAIAANKAWSKAHAALRKDDKDIAASEQATAAEGAALREFLPEYYKGSPLIVWREKRKDGTTQMFYTVTGNQSAWPAEDIIIGALQSDPDSVADFAKTAGATLLQQRFGPGMLAKTVWRTATGDELAGTFSSLGPIETLGKEVPGKARIMAEALGFGVADVVGGQASGVARQAYAAAQKGAEPQSGVYTSRRDMGDILAAQASLVRTYRIESNDMARIIRARVMKTATGIDVAKRNIATGRDEQANQRWRAEALDRLRGVMSNARAVSAGMLDDGELEAVLRDAKLTEDEAAYVMGDSADDKPEEYAPKERKTYIEKVREGGSQGASRLFPRGFKPPSLSTFRSTR